MARLQDGVAIAWLAILVVGIAVWTVIDTRQYRHFIAVTDSRARQAFYWRWTIQSFVLLSGASLLTLWWLGRLDTLGALPAEFRGLVPTRPTPSAAPRSMEMWLGMIVGGAISTLVSLAIWLRRIKGVSAPVPDAIAPLIPRTRAERLAVLPLCINAGVSEELFFRLALPLLITTVTGSAMIGLGVAVVLFGLVHWYQGWKGVVATTLVGALMTVIYCTSGSLVRVMIVHAIIDVVGLIVRPLLAARAAARAATHGGYAIG